MPFQFFIYLFIKPPIFQLPLKSIDNCDWQFNKGAQENSEKPNLLFKKGEKKSDSN